MAKKDYFDFLNLQTAGNILSRYYMNKKIIISIISSFIVLSLSNSAMAGTVNLPKTGLTKCYDTAGTQIPCARTGQDGEIQAGVAWPNPRFVDNGDGTVTDRLTGLMWTKNANLYSACITWYQAMDYVAGMNAGTYQNYGHTDWRLPNINELESLMNADEGNTSAWLNNKGYINVQNRYYWSSTTSACYPDFAWFLGMSNGFVYDGNKSSDCFCVWPVRSGPCGGAGDAVSCLPKTGQTTSYHSGDDGALQKGVAWPNPRFTDNADGTVTDNLTGLIWTKNANLDLPGGRIWKEAFKYVAGMNAETNQNYGHADWRLPNRKELRSLIDYSQHNPALPQGHPFINVRSFNYWSSTSYVYFTESAWVVIMSNGNVYYCNKPYNYDYVWPVRGGP